MCARRFLMVVFVLTLLAVAGGFALFQFGNKALMSQAVPTGHFSAASADGAPNYLQDSGWLARPGMANDPSQWVPDGIQSPTAGNAAVFYIHPTTYLERDRWNAPIMVGGDTEFRTRLFVQSQASAFNGAGRVWAPRYRQAAFGAFLLKSDDARKALDFAYADVAAAFDQFLKENPQGPIILAGHSQGALHLERLLKEKVAGKPLARRIVAAYVVGWPISTTADLPALGLPPCKVAKERGCILSWMSFGEPANPGLLFDEWARTKGLTGGSRRQTDALCVNPVSGVKDGSTTATDNPGTLVPTADFSSATLRQASVGARCGGGVLTIEGDIPAFVPPPLPGNNFHVYDYALFWGAIRRDVERRLAAWH